MNHIVCLHGLPETIVSDHDPKFTLLFWTEIHRLLGIKLAKSTAFHPQTNGASERMICKMSQVLHTLVRPNQLDWQKHLPMTESTISSSMSTSTGFMPFELMYGYLLWIIQSIGESSFADNVHDMVIRAHNTIITSHVNQTHQANQQRQGDDPLLEVGRNTYLSTENLSLPKAQAQKLLPKYIGPYKKHLIIHSPYQTSYSNVEYTLHFMLNYSGQQS
jgi:hypothetical protein